MTTRLRRAIGFVLIVAVGIIAIQFSPLHWLVVLLTASILFAFGAAISKHVSARTIMINAAGACLGLAAFEGYLGIKSLAGDGTRMEGSITKGFTHLDDQLGYAPNKDVQVSARKIYGGSLIYDVVYSIGSNGLRIAPPIKPPLRGCIVFFGDSVTFGEGVNDQEAFPYRVGIKTGGKYAIVNLAFSGYGPHQILANLQSSHFEEIISCRPTCFIYLTIPEHIARVAGLTAWDRHGPRYRLKSDGTVTRVGNFDTPLVGLPNWIASIVANFYTWQKFFGYDRQPNEEDLELYLSVIHEAADITHMRYPRSTFQVILWDGRADPRLPSIENNLTAGRVRVHRLTSAIPDFKVNWSKYVLSKHDMHPNVRQHDLLATYITHQILRHDCFEDFD